MFSRDQVLALMRDRVHHPAGMRELLQILKVPKDERTSFKRHVKNLVASGDLIQIRGHRFGLPEKMDLYVGRLQTHPAGYGFVAPERQLDAGGDIYISGPHLNEAMHGDRVVVRIERIKEGGRAEGRIIRILERANASIVGRYDRGDLPRAESRGDGMGYVVPFDRRVSAFEDPDDPPFDAAAFLHALDARDDAVAVHRFVEMRTGDVDVAAGVELTLGRDEAVAGRMRLQPADVEVHLLGQSESLASNLNEIAGRNE